MAMARHRVGRPRDGLLPYGSRRCSSMAEHLICNLEVVGSTPIGGFGLRDNLSPRTGDGEVDINDLVMVITPWVPCG